MNEARAPVPRPFSSRAQSKPRSILHIDMDAFYASIEQLRRPELAQRPVIVGGVGPRGVVAAASYEARFYGVRSAMSASQARRLCPEAVFLAGDKAHYRKVSEVLMAVLSEFTPLVEPLALDEAFLDVSRARRLFGDAQQIAAELRRRIEHATGLTSSAGVASNKLLAKLASEEAKPTPSPTGAVPGPGVVVVVPGKELEFLHPLPAGDLWGVGPATMKRLSRLGVVTIGDVAALDVDQLVAALGLSHGRHLHALARGIDDREVQPQLKAKSVSHEETFERDLFDRTELERSLARMGDAVATRLRSQRALARTFTVKVRYRNFATITRSQTLKQACDDTRTVTSTALALFERVDITGGVRLIGFAASSLEKPGHVQLTIDDSGEATEAWRQADAAVDEIRDRFGAGAISSAAAVSPPPRRSHE